MNISTTTGKHFNRAEQLFLILFYICKMENKTKDEIFETFTTDQLFSYDIKEQLFETFIMEGYESLPTLWEKQTIEKFFDFCLTSNVFSKNFWRMYAHYKRDLSQIEEKENV